MTLKSTMAKVYEGFDTLSVAPAVANPAGIHPSGFKVLIRPDEVAEKIGSIILAPESTEKQKYATTKGTIIAIGAAAFTHITDAEWAGATPKAGDRVIYTKYGGMRVEGRDTLDGKDYLLVKGEDIHAIIED